MQIGARLAIVVAGGVAALGATGCSVGDSGAGKDLVAGKELFIQKCGSCHVLGRAGTSGTSGPDLDAAFHRARQDGFDASTIEGMVRAQIKTPNPYAQTDPKTGKRLSAMPDNLVTGDDAAAVAHYVSKVVSEGGEDTGVLASIGGKKKSAATTAKNGLLSIPADPTGLLAYNFDKATAEPGKLEVQSKNDAQIDHDIALEGNGVNAKGEIVKGGGVSEFETTLKAGTYTFYCTVPGHREGGMEGTLTVKK